MSIKELVRYKTESVKKLFFLKILLFSVTLMIVLCCGCIAQIPANGTYTYKIAFAEYEGNTMGATCTVIIKGDSIKVLHNGKGNLTGKKDDILDAGIIMKHRKSGEWIIAHDKKDAKAKDVGGCSEGPAVIDFKKKIFWSC